MMMNGRSKSKAKEHHQGRQRLVLSRLRLTLSRICVHIVIVIRIVNHASGEDEAFPHTARCIPDRVEVMG